MSKLRIKLGATPQDCHISIVGQDEEVEFSHLIRRLMIGISANELPFAYLEMYVPEGDIELDHPMLSSVRIRDHEVLTAQVEIKSGMELVRQIQEAADSLEPKAEIQGG